MTFPVVVYKCKSWTIKKAEHWRTGAFKLWCWRWLLRVLWTAKRSSPSILKEINPEYSSEGLILKLRLQYFGHLLQTADSLEKTLMLEEIEGKRKSGWQSMKWWIASPTSWTLTRASSGRRWGTGRPGMLQSMGSQRLRHDLATEQQQQPFLIK